MTTEVLHIILGDCPRCRESDITSGRLFAEKNGYVYTVLNTIPEELSDYRYLEAVSDLVRVRYAAETSHNLLYLDWDILLHDDFELPSASGIYTGCDHAIFYKTDGNEQFFKDVLQLYIEYPEEKCKQEYCRLWKCWKRVALQYDLKKLGKYTHH